MGLPALAGLIRNPAVWGDESRCAGWHDPSCAGHLGAGHAKLAWHGPEAADPRAGGRQAVRGPDMEQEPGVLRHAAGLPDRVAAGERPAGGRGGQGGRPGRRRQGPARHRFPAGRARVGELPVHEPGRAQAGTGDRWGQRGRRGREFHRRPAQQRRPPPPGGHPASGSGRTSPPRPARSCSRTI